MRDMEPSRRADGLRRDGISRQRCWTRSTSSMRWPVTGIERSGFSEFDSWLALAKRTRELLDAALDAGELPAGGADYLADRTLPHVESVQAGFIGWLRSDAAGVDELRYLLGRVAALRVDGPVTEAERRAADAETAAERAFLERAGHPA